MSSRVLMNGFCAWLAKFIEIWETTLFLVSSPANGLGMIFRYAMAPSCQSTCPSPLRSGVRTTWASGAATTLPSGPR